MKATIFWTAADGTTKHLIVKGRRFDSQLWDSGRAIVVARDGKDRLLERVHVKDSPLIHIVFRGSRG